MRRIVFGDNLEVLQGLPDAAARLIYIDPPFNTGKVQARQSIRTVRDENGDRTGFKGQRYRTEHLGSSAYEDFFDDYLAFLEPRLLEAKRILTADGSFFFHIDYREVHYCKVLLDGIFGRDSFKNEIIWSYDYGGRPKNRWPAKHDTILWYSVNPEHYIFDYDAIDRIPYMAPGLVGPEKAERGKTPTDVWWNTIVSPTGKEKTGYPTQKPLKIIERIVEGTLAARRSYPRLLRRQRHDRRGSSTQRPRIPARRQQPRGSARHGPQTRVRCSRAGRFRGRTGCSTVTDQSLQGDRMNPRQITDADVQLLAALAGTMKDDYLEDDAAWEGSPFARIKTRPSRQVGKIGEDLVAGWCAAKGLDVVKTGDSQADRIIEGVRTEIKFSTLWKAGGYKFQQLRDQNYEMAICLGISPFDAHCWVIPKPVIMEQWGKYGGLQSQHGGASGVDTAWLSVDLSCVPPWLSKCGGRLREAFVVLQQLTGG